MTMMWLCIFAAIFVISFSAERILMRLALPVLLPELLAFPSQERKRAAKYRGRTYSWTLAGMVLVIVVALSTGWGLAFFRAVLALPPRMHYPLLVLIFIALQLVAPLAPVLVARNSMRRELRKRLVELGIPVCISCGYDLRGQTEPRCPECGSEVKSAAAGVQGLRPENMVET